MPEKEIKDKRVRENAETKIHTKRDIGRQEGKKREKETATERRPHARITRKGRPA